jgi:hypothetical protein
VCHARTHARGERIDPSTKPAQVLVGADKFRRSFATPALPCHSELVTCTRPGVCADCHVNSVTTQFLLMRFFACNRTTLVILALSSTCVQPHHTRHSCTLIHMHATAPHSSFLHSRPHACNRTTLVILALSYTCMQPHHTRHSCTPSHIASIVCGAPQWASASSARIHRLPCAIYLFARAQIHDCSHSTHFLWIAATH